MATKTSDLAKHDGNQHEKKKNVRVNSNRIYRLIGEVDRPLLIVIIALVCIGSVMIFSSSYAYADSKFGDSYYFARSQVGFALTGIIIMAVIARTLDYRILKSFAYIFFAGAQHVGSLFSVFSSNRLNFLNLRLFLPVLRISAITRRKCAISKPALCPYFF